MSTLPMERRGFLKFSLAASSGLMIGFYFPIAGKLMAQERSGNVFMPNAFVRIGTNEKITIIVNHSEMGQGVYTALPMLLAEELDANWKDVGYEPAPVDPKYNHPVFGMQMTGGSSSVWSAFEQFRKAGAAARAMLVAAAAQQWGVSPDSLKTQAGAVMDPGGRRLTYGQLAEAAAKLPPPAQAPLLKDPKEFKIIGKPLRRLDTPEKINGKAVFGIDVKTPGMLTAVVARGPIFGAKVKRFDDSRARSMPGVRKIVAVPTGVAVIADTFWQAKLAREALQIDWDEGAMQGFDTGRMMAQFREQAKSPGQNVRNDGDADAAFAKASKKVEAVYEVPYLSHLMMEPLNCAVDLRADSCVISTGTQFQTVDRANAAIIAGLPPEKVQINTTYLGGGFGRRANPHSDFVVEAVHVAKAAGAPVKVVWTREDDMNGGYYRPAFLHACAGSVDESGSPASWRSRLVGQSIMKNTPFEAMMSKGYDPASVEGVDDLPYAIPNLSVQYHAVEVGVPVQWWRSVGHSHTAFATESFIDELATLAKKDPYQFRRSLLQKHPRHLAVLDLAAKHSGWGTPLPKGRSRGVAVHASFESYAAQVAEVSVEDGKVRVHRIVCAIDCGKYVNPNIIAAQAEGGAIFGASAALFQELTFTKGRLEQTNFHTFPVMRMNETPVIETHIVQSNEKSGGIGEPGVPCTAPAIANAIFAGTGKRIRKLPIRMTEAV